MTFHLFVNWIPFHTNIHQTVISLGPKGLRDFWCVCVIGCHLHMWILESGTEPFQLVSRRTYIILLGLQGWHPSRWLYPSGVTEPISKQTNLSGHIDKTKVKFFLVHRHCWMQHGPEWWVEDADSSAFFGGTKITLWGLGTRLGSRTSLCANSCTYRSNRACFECEHNRRWHQVVS